MMLFPEKGIRQSWKYHRDQAKRWEAKENLVLSLHVSIGLWSPRRAGMRRRGLCFSTNRGQALLHTASSWFSEVRLSMPRHLPNKARWRGRYPICKDGGKGRGMARVILVRPRRPQRALDKPFPPLLPNGDGSSAFPTANAKRSLPT